MVYEEEIELVKKLIEKENVPTKYAEILATLMFITAEFGAGDVLAGAALGNVIRAQQDGLKTLAKKILGHDVRHVNEMTMLDILEVLGKKFKVFEALQYISSSGGNTTKLEELAKEV